MNKIVKITLAAAATFGAGQAQAATFIVQAAAHSVNSGSGSGLNTLLSFFMGQAISVTSSTNDLWSAGALPRYSDGSGLVADRFKTAFDDADPAIPNGTLIGQNFGTPTFLGHTAPFGALVGRYADGAFQTFGANFSGFAAGTGALSLFYWDSNFGDNFGEIAFDVSSPVPEPTAWTLMLAGFGLIGFAMRGRQKARVSFV